MKYLGLLSTKRICSLLLNPYLGGLFRNSFWDGGGGGGGGGGSGGSGGGGGGSSGGCGGGGRGEVVQLPNCFKLAVNWKNDNGVTISRHDISSNFFDVLFLLSSLVTGPCFMSMSSLVLELRRFLFIKDWPEIQKLEIPPSEFCSVSEDWVSEQGIPNLARTSLIKCYWMLQNTRFTGVTVSELLKENQLGQWVNLPATPTQIKIDLICVKSNNSLTSQNGQTHFKRFLKCIWPFFYGCIKTLGIFH